jgi:hypothetical protein
MVPVYAGYSIYAELKVGSNGTNEGVAELVAGNATGGTAYGSTTWDDNVSDGVDSDWVQVQLVAGPSGVTWTVGDQPPVQVAGSVFGDVLALKVRAAVSGGDRQTSWRDLVASFYLDGDTSQPAAEQLTLARARNPVASTIGAAPDAEADQVVDITPDGYGYQTVALTASVRIQSLGDMLPSPDALFGQVYLYTSAAPVEAAPSMTVAYVAVAEPEPALFEPSVVTISNFTEDLESTELSLLA